jgi:fumarate hydratase subunit alpha
LAQQIETLEKVAFNLIKKTVVFLPSDIKNALLNAFANESNEVARLQLKTILDNVELAEKARSPMCQDTGTIIFFVRAGGNSKYIPYLEEAVTNAVRRATSKIPLRPNAVNPFTQRNSGDNTGRLIPQIHWEIIHGEKIEISVLAKGGGSENVSTLGMINPAEGVKGIVKFALDAVVNAGPKPCPPTILGIGIGGGADMALILAKKALLRPLNEPHIDPQIRDLEEEILRAANMTGIGPMGLGGKTTALGVRIDYAYRHPASFPIAVVFSCWALRRASASVFENGKVKYFSSKNEGKA